MSQQCAQGDVVLGPRNKLRIEPTDAVDAVAGRTAAIVHEETRQADLAHETRGQEFMPAISLGGAFHGDLASPHMSPGLRTAFSVPARREWHDIRADAIHLS